MIFSDQYQRLVGRIYTFSFLAIALAFLPVEFVMQSGIRIDLSEKSVVVGAFAAVALILALVSLPLLLRDFLHTQIADRQKPNEGLGGRKADFSMHGSRASFLERHASSVLLFSGFSSLVEALLPVALAATIGIVRWQDIVSFAGLITN